MITPKIFHLDGVDGHSSVVDGEVPAEQENSVALAIASCPE
jgi:ferredoxin